jgi:DNA (cytosine-5)-methyltransferase 1
MFTPNTVERHGVVYGIDSLSSDSMKSANPHSGFHEMGIAKCLDTSDGNASKNQGGMCVVYDCRGNGEGEIAPTVTGDHQNMVTDYTGIAVHGFDRQAIDKYADSKVSSTLRSRDYKEATDLIVEHNQECYPSTTGALCANSHPGSYTGQDAFNDMLPVIRSSTQDRRYLVRRLIPLECCRLQGYPDGWTENLAVSDPTIEEVEFFTKVWADWAAINGTKPKSLNQVIKWLADPQSDSAEYKAYGNSLAIPCSYDVLRRISKHDPA